MIEIAAPFYVAEVEGAPLRFFRPPAGIADLPWTVQDDVIAISGVTPASKSAILRRLRDRFASRYRLIRHKGESLTVASFMDTAGLVHALDGWGLCRPGGVRLLLDANDAALEVHATEVLEPLRGRPKAEIQTAIDDMASVLRRDDDFEGAVIEVVGAETFYRHAFPEDELE